MTDAAMIIVGAGPAGASAAIALREQGWVGKIIVVGAESHAPYERPPLSKNIVVQAEAPALPVLGTAAQFAAQHVEHRHRMRVTSLDPLNHKVHLHDGTELRYARLLLATGAYPRRFTGEAHAPIHYLRTFEDALALRPVFQRGGRVAILGGGFIGLELAASARKCGCTVTVLEYAPKVLMRGVPASVADLLAARHLAEGVDLRCGISVSKIAADRTLELSDGSQIAADCIVAGIGALPDTALAEAAGLQLENGIAVDAQLRTSSSDIFAAGDCCSFPLALYGGRRLRLEAWRNALDQGKVVARNMLGAQEIFNAVPWFWSDQYDVHVQIAGLADGATHHVSRDLGPDAELVFHLDPSDRLLAASGAGPIGKIAKNIKLAEILVAAHTICRPQDLADPNFALKSLMVR